MRVKPTKKAAGTGLTLHFCRKEFAAMATSYQPSLHLPPLPETEHLPESDGKPMAETDVHRSQMIGLLECLGEYYRSDPNVYVTGNILLYLGALLTWH